MNTDPELKTCPTCGRFLTRTGLTGLCEFCAVVRAPITEQPVAQDGETPNPLIAYSFGSGGMMRLKCGSWYPRDAVDPLIAALRSQLEAVTREKDDARALLNQIGFACAGTELNTVSNKVLEHFAAYPGNIPGLTVAELAALRSQPKGNA